LGVFAIFFDIGLEYLALGSINDYAAILNLPSPENYVWFASAGMVIGYILGVIFIPKSISQSTALLVSTVLGVIVTTLIVLFPAGISIYLVAVLGLANALMWPAIWPMAIADLGKFTKMGSSLLVTGIIGGAFLPLLFGYFADKTSHQVAYLVCIPAYIYILYYALSGSKIRTK
jgi:fucose permease